MKNQKDYKQELKQAEHDIEVVLKANQSLQDELSIAAGAMPKLIENYIERHEQAEAIKPTFVRTELDSKDKPVTRLKAEIFPNGILSIVHPGYGYSSGSYIHISQEDTPFFVRWCKELCGDKIPEKTYTVTKDVIKEVTVSKNDGSMAALGFVAGIAVTALLMWLI